MIKVCNDLDIDYLTVDAVYEDLSLIQLDLSNKGITDIPDNIFSGLSNLVKLDLSGNPLKTISEETFTGLSQLEELNLSSCAITEFNNPFVNLSGLLFLNFNLGRDVSLTPDLLKPLSNLSILILSSKIRLPDDFLQYLPKLRTLHITSSIQLNSSLFDSLNIRELFISGQKRVEPQLFEHLGNIVELHITNNSISTLPADIFEEMNSLEVLNLSKNSLKKLDDKIFDHLQALKELDLSFNFLNYLPNNINMILPKLKILRIEGNQIRDINISGISIYF